MRVLLTTRGSSGHLGPLVPFARALEHAGHEVLVAAQRQHERNVVRTGLPFAPFDEAPPEAWQGLLEWFSGLGVEPAGDTMVSRFFAGIDTRAGLPGLEAIVDDYDPHLILRETWEFGSTLVSEAHGIPLARVGLGLASIEERTIRVATPSLAAFRQELGLPPDPDGARMRATPYLTTVPEPIDVGTGPLPSATWRFAEQFTTEPSVNGYAGAAPLVYLTFGSVTAAEHLPFYPALYREAIAVLAPLDARILVTIGEDRDPAELGDLPPNVQVERWIPQDAVIPHAAVVVSHGGFGTTMGTLRHGVPLVVLPLFSHDQWENAAAVQRIGAGIALDAERGGRRATALPDARSLNALTGAVRTVLTDRRYRDAAESVAAAARALPPVSEAAKVLDSLVDRAAGGR